MLASSRVTADDDIKARPLTYLVDAKGRVAENKALLAQSRYGGPTEIT